MEDLATTVTLCAGVVAAMWGLDRLVTWLEGRKTPEQRKEEERWEWKHGRWS